jgi:hypothetical protein
MLARLLENFGNPFERTVTQSQEATLPARRTPAPYAKRPADGSSRCNMLVRPPDTLHPMQTMQRKEEFYDYF